MNRRDFVKLAAGAGLYVPVRSYFDLGAWAWPPVYAVTFPELRVIGEDGRILRDVRIELDSAGRLRSVSDLDLAMVGRFEIQYRREYAPTLDASGLPAFPERTIPTIEFDPDPSSELT